MLKQLELIERVKSQCINDNRIVAAMMYGSFAKGKGDGYSDIEFVLYLPDSVLQNFDKTEWINDLYPSLLIYVNEFGITEVIFDGLVRGEFHFYPEERIPEVSSWRCTDWFPTIESALVKDQTGELTRHLEALVGPAPRHELEKQGQFIVDSLIGWTLAGWNVLNRGEYARALNLLWWVQMRLLALVRLQNGQFENWPNPSRELEDDLSTEDYELYVRCTSDLQPEKLRVAYQNAWQFGKRLIIALRGTLIHCEDKLLSDMDAAMES